MRKGHSPEMISIKLDADTVSKIKKLGRLDETVSLFIKKAVEHVSYCDKFWENRFE